MLVQLAQQYQSQIQSLNYLMLIINIILNLIFAGAVARDAGNLYKLGLKPALVSGTTWAFATLLGGIMSAAVYWLIHHSNITRNIKELRYEHS